MSQADYKFIVKYSSGDVKTAAWLYWKKKVFKIRDILLSLLLVFGYIGSVVGGAENHLGGAIPSFFVILFILCLIWGLNLLYYRKIYLKMLRESQTVLNSDINVTLLEDSVVVRTSQRDVRNYWKDLTEIWNSAQLLFLLFGNEYVFFPNIDNSTREEFFRRIPPNKSLNSTRQP